MNRLDLEVFGEASIAGVEALPIGLVDGAVEVEGAMRAGSAARLGADNDM